MRTRPATDVVVIGGGLAGLTAATFLARAGRPVILFEKSRQLGGRATTQAQAGFSFNFGPHALYRAGAGTPILRELGVAFGGGTPDLNGDGLHEGRLECLPGGPLSLLTTRLLGPGGKLEAARLLAMLALGRLDPAPLQCLTVRQWLERDVRREAVRRLLAALVRVSTYADEPDRQSAGAALAQVRLALTGNVLYLDGGWQALVAGLRRAAETAGVQIVTETRVAAILRDDAVRGVRLADGAMREAATVIVAADPATARALVDGSDETPLRRWADTAIPVMAACLDVGLRRLPVPPRRLVLGIDHPLYFSIHSAVARLAPAGGATIHLAKYLRSGGRADPRADERELENLLELAQPGWRDALVERRFLPRMTVTHALVTAAGGGLAGRPGPAVPGVRGLYVAGDWVGPEGMLADAALASAKQAAALVAAANDDDNPAFTGAGIPQVAVA